MPLKIIDPRPTDYTPGDWRLGPQGNTVVTDEYTLARLPIDPTLTSPHAANDFLLFAAAKDLFEGCRLYTRAYTELLSVLGTDPALSLLIPNSLRKELELIAALANEALDKGNPPNKPE